ILTDFANNIGGSPYFNINNSYCNATDCSVSGLPVINRVLYGAASFDNYSHGTSLNDAAVADIVARALNNGDLPRDLNGVYFVLTSADVNETSGECSRYCGWHTHTQIGSQDIKFSYVGNPDRCLGSCAAQSSVSPNDNPGADGMANIIGHELEE